MTRWLAILIFCSLTAAQAATPVDLLRSTAERAAPFSPAVASLDPRVQVAGCDLPLIAELTSVRNRQATVKVSCEQPRWQLYVPVRATGGQQVMVLRRSIAGGTIVRAEDVAQVTREAAAGYGAFDRPDQIIGLQTRRALPAGRVLSPADLISPPMVRRGDQIAIEVHSAAVTIRMNGVALADGGFGQRIPVRNVSSGKRLEGIVRSAGTVEVPR